MTRFIVVAAVLAMSVVAPARGRPSPAAATGDVPVRYVVCDRLGRSCVVAARFKDLDACQYYQQVDEMVCDRRSYPGEIRCRSNPHPPLASTYCVL